VLDKDEVEDNTEGGARVPRVLVSFNGRSDHRDPAGNNNNTTAAD